MIPPPPPIRALTEFSQQLSAEADTVNHSKKNSEFFAKKSTQYQKLVTSMKVGTQLSPGGITMYMYMSLECDLIVSTIFLYYIV